MLQFDPLSENIGARVVGLDLTKECSADDAEQLRAAMRKYRLLLFRQGAIEEADQIAIMRCFGNVIAERATGEIASIVAAEPDSYVAGTLRLLFHSDQQNAPSGALQLISLYALEMERPEPTLFADMTRAEKRLPADLYKKVENLSVVQVLDLSANYENERMRLSKKPPETPDCEFSRAVHPVIGTHPFTGEKLVNVSQLCSSHIVGMSDEESDAIFALLEPYQYDEEGVYPHVWEKDDLVIWDNIALQHGRDEIGPSGRRLRRVTVNPLTLAEMLPDVRPNPERYPEFVSASSAAG